MRGRLGGCDGARARFGRCESERSRSRLRADLPRARCPGRGRRGRPARAHRRGGGELGLATATGCGGQFRARSRRPGADSGPLGRPSARSAATRLGAFECGAVASCGVAAWAGRPRRLGRDGCPRSALRQGPGRCSSGHRLARCAGRRLPHFRRRIVQDVRRLAGRRRGSSPGSLVALHGLTRAAGERRRGYVALVQQSARVPATSTQSVRRRSIERLLHVEQMRYKRRRGRLGVRWPVA